LQEGGVINHYPPVCTSIDIDSYTTTTTSSTITTSSSGGGSSIPEVVIRVCLSEVNGKDNRCGEKAADEGVLTALYWVSWGRE